MPEPVQSSRSEPSGFVEQCVEMLREFEERYLYVGPVIPITPGMARVLEVAHLGIADVGAAGGVDARWTPIKNWCHFYTFEPREGEATTGENTTSFPVALSDEPGERTLHLMEFRQASSLHEINRNVMADFAVNSFLRVVDKTNVRTDTLDRCFQACSGSAQFLKLDVEGAELEVLRGAQITLRESCLGLQVEAGFHERHLGSGLLYDMASFLRDRGFELFALSRQHMLRRNLNDSMFSQPQLIWADIVFFLSRAAFLERIASASEADRTSLSVKFIVLLLAYRAHDFATEMIETIRERQLIPRDIIEDLQLSVRTSLAQSPRLLLRAGVGALLGIAVYAMAVPFPSLRPLATYFVKRRCAHFLHPLLRLATTDRRQTFNAADPWF